MNQAPIPGNPVVQTTNPTVSYVANQGIIGPPTLIAAIQAAIPYIPGPPSTLEGIMSIAHIANAIVRYITNDCLIAIHGPWDHPRTISDYPIARVQPSSSLHSRIPIVRLRGTAFRLHGLEAVCRAGARQTLRRDIHRRLNPTRRHVHRRRHHKYQLLDGLPLVSRSIYQAVAGTRPLPVRFIHVANFVPSVPRQFSDVTDRNSSGMVYLTPTWEWTYLRATQHWLNGLSRFCCLVIGRIMLQYRRRNASLDLRAYYHGLKCGSRDAIQRFDTITRMHTILPDWRVIPWKHSGSWTLRQVTIRNSMPDTDREFILHVVVGLTNERESKRYIIAIVPQENVPLGESGDLYSPETLYKHLNTFRAKAASQDHHVLRRSWLVGPLPGVAPDLRTSAARWAQHQALRNPNEAYNIAMVEDLIRIEYVNPGPDPEL